MSTYNIKPEVLAHDFLNALFSDNDHYKLKFWQNEFYEYANGCYNLTEETFLKSLITEFFQESNEKQTISELQVKITNSLINNILLNIKGTKNVCLPNTIKLNTWINGDHKNIQTKAFNNGLFILYLDKLTTTLVEHTPDYFTLTKLPYDCDGTAKCPNWLQFLDEIMEGDKARIQLLQEWAGYLLTTDLKQQKFLLCVGEGANGKSVFFEVIERMVGTGNCSHVQLTNFGENFALSSTLGKVLNVTTESNKEIGEYAETMLKAYTAGDALTFQRKFKDPINAVPTAKIMIATNELPRVHDKTQGVWRRMLLVPFERTFAEQEQNKDLADKLSEELSGIFNWALEGMKSLIKNKSFIQPEKCATAISDYRRDANPARAFLEENYMEAAKSNNVCCSEVYTKYKNWCNENGYTTMNQSNFGKEVVRTFPNVEKARPSISGKRINVYQGLSEQKELCNFDINNF
jgi:putative DNA primase/helicase